MLSSCNALLLLLHSKEKLSNFKQSLKLSFLTLPGAVAGAYAAIKIDGELFKNILAIVMILILIAMLFPKKKEAVKQNVYIKIPWLVYPAMLLTGFYGGFLQAGVGLILMAMLHYLMRLDILTVNMHKAFIVFIFSIPAMLIFIFSGNVNWLYGIVLSAGNAIGAWWSVRISVKTGEKFIKIVMFAAVLIMALKLFNVF